MLPRTGSIAVSGAWIRYEPPGRLVLGAPHGASETQEVVVTRDEATHAVVAAKEERGLTWAALAAAVGRSAVWTTAALLGQAAMGPEEARRAAEALGLGVEAERALMRSPMKGSLEASVPVDPLIYRFREIVQVYGTTIKELIHEEFGDGIMSAIDFEMTIARKPDPKGDRVAIVLDGKFLPYRVW